MMYFKIISPLQIENCVIKTSCSSVVYSLTVLEGGETAKRQK